MSRYIRYWYTYRATVAVVIALVLTFGMFWLYAQQVACDAGRQGCSVNIAVHPEDRLFSQAQNVSPQIVMVGIDDASIQKIGAFPVPRDRYALAIRNLEAAGAGVVALDVNLSDPRDPTTDTDLARTLSSSTVPVVLSYAGQDIITGSGHWSQTSSRTNPAGIDQAPLKEFWCADADSNSDVPCRQSYKNVILGSTDFHPDSDGVVRKAPMFVQPACYSDGACGFPEINPLGFAAYRAFSLLPDPSSGPALQESSGQATFGTTWQQPMPVDSSGAALINYQIGPHWFKDHSSQYISFGDVWAGSFSADQVKDKIVLIGAYELTGVHDELLTPGGGGVPMPGIEVHANLVDMLLATSDTAQPRFLVPEAPAVLFLVMLVLAVVTAIGVARVTVLWGLVGTVGAISLFTLGTSAVAVFVGWVPDLFHPWLVIGLTYTGVTAYRFLYEDREKRKVTALFGMYLKPEIVNELAKTRGGVNDLLRGGVRRDVTLMFVDIRGFTSMSESMAASDVTEVVQMYLDHLSGIIFTWDGTVDKYVGDEIMAFWNAPRQQDNHALLALRCAYDMVNRGTDLQQRLLAKGLPPIRWGIGINTGPAVVGNMGSRSRVQYTALGDTVNTAARFCAHAPAFHVLIGQETYEMCRDLIAVELVPGVQLKGKSAETFRIYDVTAIRESPTSPWVPFPTQLAADAHQTYTAHYTQQTVIAASETGSTDILVGEAAEEALARQAQAPS